MKNKIFIISSFIYSLLAVPALPLCAQSPVTGVSYVDSLQNILKGKQSDSLRIATLLLLSDYYSDKDTSLAVQYVRKAAGYVKQNSFQAALVQFYTAGVYFDTDFKRSEAGYLRAEQLLRRFAGKAALVYRARAWNNYGALRQRQDDELQYARILLDHVIPLSQQAGDSARMARNYHNLGMIFSNQLDYTKAKSYLSSAISILEKIAPNSLEMADAYMFASKNYIYLKDYPPIRPMLDSAYDILSEDPNSVYLIDFYLVEGMYYSRLRQYAKAMESFDKGILLCDKLGKAYDRRGIMLQIYFTYKAQENYPKALQTMKAIMRSKPPITRYQDRMLYYYELAQTSEKVGDMTGAYQWLRRYTELADSSYQERTKAEIADLEAKYKSVEKEKKINDLQAKNERATLTIKNNRLLSWLLAVVCLFLLVVTVLVLLFYRNNKRLWAQQQQLHELELQKIKQDHRISMLSAMLDGQERERTRLARDLHDGLGGLLSSIKIELSQLSDKQHVPMKVGIHKTLSHLDEAVNELRRIARSLMPEILMKYGLAEATKEFCKNLKETGANLVCQVFNYKDSMPREKQIVIYRIIQELVNNALKHAQASQILVIIQQSGDTLFVTVEDDGKSFDINKTNTKAGSGLSNIKARADFLNARFEIQSAPQKGTTVTVECDML
ncbi:ATP-binding protein [Dyadobacter chenhuakuii]|uniref:Sensor histidine kinase n=1 Tax=Dyadobacter chenhuakuii TaxID=2909339 RepID=A0ABY4XM61_9BACT|nr:sensor histidine kinase [Dyadobacter chenhuakuii]MCF2494132.1 sensor histidine kinase [Dyadobacter chenhuakuii]USJ31260.1 sensor histidine kinase [Dyadobacter chenhuakuii]